ncbi:MAG TPA: DUF2206 domain-containing protein [Candidatus Saccharimonadales bacterium]|nr:DUF2206 domain-containing protein [Candidatus Saccharimonadales bacterium]
MLTTALWVALVLYVPFDPFSTVFSLAYLSLMPGYVLYRTIAGYIRGEMKARVLAYIVGLSLISLMVIGLVLNQVLPWLAHMDRPLVSTTMAPAIAGFVVFFTFMTAFRRKTQNLRRFKKYLTLAFWRSKSREFWLTVTIGLLLVLLPFLGVAGATMLNNSGPNWLALGAIGLVGAVIFGLSWTKRVQLQSLYPLALYSATLTILLGTSMRGWEVTGHDVMQEFQVFQLTTLHSLWDMKFYQDAYTACLSITILPTVLQKLSGMPDLYLFKLWFQLLFALIAPLMYSGLRTYVPRKMAFLAAVIFVTFPAFLTDIMMLNRQEVAIFCFALALFVALDKRLSTFARHALMIILFGGMVLSHYSTSYITALILIVATGLGFGLWVIRPLTRRLKIEALQAKTFTLFPAYIAPMVLLMIIGWSGLATHTAGNIADTIKGIGNDVVRVVNPNAAPPRQAAPAEKAEASVDTYADYAYQTRQYDASEYYPDSTSTDFEPIEVPERNAPLSPLASALHLPADLLQKVYDLARQGYVGLLTLLLAVGLVLMVFRRTATRLPLQYPLLGIACLVVVVIQVVLPSEAVNYGLARVIQQGLVILALPGVAAAVWVLGKVKFKFELRFRMVAGVLVALFLVLSGFISTLTGGYRPVLAFSNSGFYYQAYYTHPEEIEADKWLAANAPSGSRVYADEFSRRRMITYANIFPEPTLVPSAIPEDSYVYLSRGNTTTGQVPVYYDGELLFYNVPFYFLNTHKTLVYNSGGVRIYR